VRYTDQKTVIITSALCSMQLKFEIIHCVIWNCR